jgi:L-fuconolactonase
MQLDAHQHFWRYDPAEHGWMDDRMTAIKRDFLPKDVRPLMDATGFNGCISVQARQNLEETRWLLQLEEENAIIAGVVGWVDLQSNDLPEQLERFAVHSELVGVRHVVQDEPDEDFMLRPAFRRGIGLLRGTTSRTTSCFFPSICRSQPGWSKSFPISHSCWITSLSR